MTKPEFVTDKMIAKRLYELAMSNTPEGILACIFWLKTGG